MTDSRYVTVRFDMLKSNFDKISGAAAVNGESVTTALNRAAAFYEVFSMVDRFHKVSWTDSTGQRRKALIYK